MSKNPTRPDESPIRVEHVTPEYFNYDTGIKPRVTNQAPSMKVFGRPQSFVETFDDVHDYQKSKTPEVIQDKAIEAEIKKDLRRRNIKTQNK